MENTSTTVAEAAEKNTYTARERSKIESLIQEWKANKLILNEIIETLEVEQGFPFHSKQPFECSPRLFAEVKAIAQGVGQRMSEKYYTTYWKMLFPPDYIYDRSDECAFTEAFCAELHSVLNSREYKFLSFPKRTILKALMQEVDNYSAKESVITKKIEKIILPKNMLSVSNLKQAFAWKYAVEMFTAYEIMMLNDIESGKGVLKQQETVKKTLVDGELEVTDVPMGTLIQDSCGCIYRKVLRNKWKGESEFDYISDGMQNYFVKLVTPGKNCIEEIRTRYGKKIGAHDRPIGYRGWAVNKTFTLVKYPDGCKTLKQPKPRKCCKMVEVENK